MAKIAVYRIGECLACVQGWKEVNLVFSEPYQPGDEIRFTADTPFARVKADACVEAAYLYLTDSVFRFRIPLAGDGLAPYPPGAFQGVPHLLSLAAYEPGERRNLALNPLDLRLTDGGVYPHVSANVETRGESVFFARNVVDGITAAAGHGVWPYQSWGIGAREDACLTVDFGRDVTVDEVVLYLRTDFPHDAYWTQATITLSDGFAQTFPLVRMEGPQRVRMEARATRWLKLDRLVKCDDPSAFPALRQLMVMGRDVWPAAAEPSGGDQ